MLTQNKQTLLPDALNKDALEDDKYTSSDLDRLWNRTSAALRKSLGEEVYSSWFIRVELQWIVADTAHLTVSTRFLKSWIETHYTNTILQALNNELLNDAKAEDENAMSHAHGSLDNGIAVSPVVAHLIFSVRQGLKTLISPQNLSKEPQHASKRQDSFAQRARQHGQPQTYIHLQGKFTPEAGASAAGMISEPANYSSLSNDESHPLNRIGALSAKISRQRECLRKEPHNANGAELASAEKSAPAKLKGASSAALEKSYGDRRPSRSLDEAMSGSPLDRRMTFQNFIVGRNNSIAHAASRRIVETLGSSGNIYNPLYIHANVGLGKTHLLQAIAHEAGGRAKHVIYLTAEKFMYSFISSLKAQTAIAFKEKLRAIDLLIIDDIQFLQGKVMQAEFCHSLNALIDVGRQIVIASDRPPQDLEQLEERVRSRLSAGLTIEIGSLEESTRIEILRSRIAHTQLLHPDFHVPDDVLKYVARNIATNGRDLDGAVNRLIAQTTLTATVLTLETAELAVRDLVRSSEPKRIKIEDIQRVVANHFQVSREDMLSARRTCVVVRPRQIAMYLSKVLTPRSLPEIGRRFGNRDHTTVLHAVRKIEELLKADTSLQEDIAHLKRMLLE